MKKLIWLAILVGVVFYIIGYTQDQISWNRTITEHVLTSECIKTLTPEMVDGSVESFCSRTAKCSIDKVGYRKMALYNDDKLIGPENVTVTKAIYDCVKASL